MSYTRQTPVQIYMIRRRTATFFGVLLLLALLGVFVYWRYGAESPVDYADVEDHFKYGSFGSDSGEGIPYWIWQVLPEMFPQYLPDPQAFLAIPASERTAIDAYKQFGFLHEPGRELPVGFSMRRVTLDRVGLNCASCHASSLRVSEGMDAERIYGRPPVYLSAAKDRLLIVGMPANTVDLQSYFQFLFDAALDGSFTSDHVMRYIMAETSLDPVESFLYRQAIPLMRQALLTRRQQLSFLTVNPRSGPGRVDSFNPYKSVQFGLPYDGTISTVDTPSVWNQRPRVGMQLHWDGNNTSILERNISAAIGIGATPAGLDMERLLRMTAWIGSPDPQQKLDDAQRAQMIDQARNAPIPAAGEMQIPAYPFAIDEVKAKQGQAIYQQQCALCHDWHGEQIGKVTPIAEIGTDRARLDAITDEMITHQNTLGTGYWWRFTHFEKTDGYANQPLDGLWARAPYLHNGAVPTLRDLLNKPEMRPESFYRGDDEYDPHGVGFRSDRPRSADGQELFLFDTTQPGNGKGGHSYGTDLSDEAKETLLEYLKSL